MSANDTANHRMAIAAYGACYSGIQQAANMYPYSKSELYIGSAKYRYNGNGVNHTTVDSWNPNKIGSKVYEEYYDGTPLSQIPADAAQHYYDRALLDVKSQVDQLYASIDTYNPELGIDGHDMGSTAMHVGMKMAEGIIKAYQPDLYGRCCSNLIRDGKIDALDAIATLRMIMGID